MFPKLWSSYRKNRAIEHYNKFLSFWKDVDPGVAEFDDAKERLAGLEVR